MSVIGLGRSAEKAASSRRAQVNVMAVKTDRRTQRTRQALMMAFVGEVLSRGYEDVSVEDIVKRANIGRSTFYMHYKSKEELLRESISRPSTILSLLVGGDRDGGNARAAASAFPRTAPTQRHVLPRSRPAAMGETVAAEMIEPRLTKVARQAHAQPSLPLAFVAVQLAEAQIALVTNWLTDKPALKPEAVASAMIATTQSSVRALLGSAPGCSDPYSRREDQAGPPDI